MIRTIQTDTNPYTLESGMSVRQEATIIPKLEEVIEKEFCFCGYECDYKELVLSGNASNWWENDKSRFIYQKLTTTDTITIKLYKNNVLVDTITNNDYGLYKDDWIDEIGRKYITFIADWNKIYTAEGHGIYYIEAEQTLAGNQFNKTSHLFDLRQYSEEIADGTIRIETVQNGNIIRSPYDYTDMNLESSIRIKGNLRRLEPKMTISKWEDTSRTFNQITDKITDQYEIETGLLPYELGKQLIYEDLLANTIKITDYNIFNKFDRRIELYPEEIPELTKPTQQTTTAYTIRFVDKIDNQIKENY